MPKIYFVSGPCGSGKSTFADAWARHLVRQDRKTVYVIHGDDFHAGFREPEDKDAFFDADGQPLENNVFYDPGDPIEVNVRNYELSIRKADAEMIEVE